MHNIMPNELYKSLILITDFDDDDIHESFTPLAPTTREKIIEHNEHNENNENN